MHLKPNHPSVAEVGRTLIGFNIVNGREVEGDLGLIESRSAVDSRDVVGLFPDSGAKDVERAAKAAQEALPDWSRTPEKNRGKVLKALLKILAAQRQRLTRIISREIGLTAKAAEAELQMALDTCAWLVAQPHGPHAGNLDETGLGSRRRPQGVVGILSSRTSPLASPCRKILAAILCGNTVVWKPSDGCPSTAYLLLRALQEAGMPPGVVNTVNGKGRGGCGKHFLAGIEKGHFQMFSFAGSVALGRIVGETCGRNLVLPDLEVGGRNPMIVMEDADLDLAVAAALADAFDGAGQRSTSLGNILLHRPIAAGFSERFLEAAAALKIGNPLGHPDVAYGPMLNAKFAEAFRNHWEKGQEGGARLLLGGAQWDEANRTDRVAGEIAKGAYMQPCIWADVAGDSWLFRNEVYGPTVNLCTVDSFEEALDAANGMPAGLTGSVFTRNRGWSEACQAGLRIGALAVNAPLLASGPAALEPWTRRQVLRPDEALGPAQEAEARTTAVHTMPTPVDWAALD